MSAPRLLCVLPFSPSATHAGSVFVRTLLGAYPRGRVAVYAYERKHRDQDRDSVEGHAYQGAALPAAGNLRRRLSERLPGRLQAALLDRDLSHRWRERLAEPAAAFARRTLSEIDAVWVVLNQRPISWYIGRHIARELDVPLYTMVMDPPEFLLAEEGLDSAEATSLLRAFDRTLTRTARLATASEAMRRAYLERYGLDAEVLIHGPTHRPDPTIEPPDDGTLRIGFAGNLYAQAEWRAFLRALDDTGWTFAGRPIEVHVWGGRVDVQVDGPAALRCHGWRPVDEVIDGLAGCHLTYLPYFLGAGWETVTRLCFPNKLATYAAAGRPVLVHGPSDSEPARFVGEQEMGVVCTGHDPVALHRALRAITDPEPVAAMCEGARRAAGILSADRFHDAFRRFVGWKSE